MRLPIEEARLPPDCARPRNPRGGRNWWINDNATCFGGSPRTSNDLGLAVAVLAAGTASADEKVDATLQKAIEAHGGLDAMSKYTASRMTMKGELSVMGMDLECTGKSAYAYPSMYSMDLNFDVMGQKVTVSQIVKGEKIKSVVKVGDMVMNTPKEQDEEIKIAMLMQKRKAVPLGTRRSSPSGGIDGTMGKKASVLMSRQWGLREFAALRSKVGLPSRPHTEGMDGDGTKEVLKNIISEFKKVNGIQV